MLNKFFSKCFNSLSTSLEESSDNGVSLSDDYPTELLCDEDSVCELLLGLGQMDQIVSQQGC